MTHFAFFSFVFFVIFQILATKNDRCSLAARILYSNFQHANNEPFSANKQFERLIRPSTLSKSLIATKSDGFDTSALSEPASNKPKPKLYDNVNNNLLKVSINKYKQNANLTDNDLFPPPPPQIPHLEHSMNRLNYQPAILTDYQEPIKSSLKTQSNLGNSDSKNYSANLILNIEDEFKRKVNFRSLSYSCVCQI